MLHKLNTLLVGGVGCCPRMMLPPSASFQKHFQSICQDRQDKNTSILIFTAEDRPFSPRIPVLVMEYRALLALATLFCTVHLMPSVCISLIIPR